ncbi:MAG: tetratricopeptide repeat protein [Alphaproteobacteria bacterium]|nr:tetratricopeptide repeat protein [Alphaproteobacteria bacterium]
MAKSDAVALVRRAADQRAGGDTDGAADSLHEALRLDPQFKEAAYNLGVLEAGRGALDAAEAAYRQALEIDPAFAHALNNLGLIRQKRGDNAAAVACFRRAIAADATYGDPYINLGVLEHGRGNLTAAADCYRKAHEIYPDRPRLLSNLGLILSRLGDHDGACRALERAAAMAPDGPLILLNLGAVLLVADRLDDARSAFERSRRADPGNVAPLVNLGSLAMAEGRTDTAEAHLREALAQAPETAEAHWNYGLCLLSRGDFANGWREYEWRWQADDFPGIRRKFSAPLWDGGALDSRTILLHGEQGVGDVVQFCRYLPLVAAAHPEARILFELDPRLCEIASASFGGIAEIYPFRNPQGDNLPTFDCAAPLMSLPHLLGTTVATIPAEVPYLKPTAAVPARADDRFVVGLSWYSKNAKTGRPRSIPLTDLAPLGAVTGVRFVNLQYGDTSEERAAAREAGFVVEAESGVDFKPDLIAFTSAVAACDLVISIDNTTVHMAGALGRPVWTLLPRVAEWRWMTGRDDTPWYPTMRLFRQPRGGDWDAVIVEVAAALDEFASASVG